ncbi:MAG: FHA domain-containing protein [Myxococcales bacterium]|nr:FHA domain-containing protein [Myxococcales bacterium]
MMDPSTRPARKVSIADHIWDAFEEMASSMGTDRDGLINQAMFMFARLNGFLDAAANGARGNGAVPAPARAASPPAVAAAPAREAPPARPARPPEPPAQKLDDDPVRREVAERVLETAAELERLIKGKSSNADISAEEPPPEDEMGMEMEDGAADSSAGGNLYLMAEGGELDKIAKDRFIIGRGKHCDFVINSGKVSREHAVVVREGADFFIEDLGSSNGTWFNKQRIKRRKVEDGDEYFICSEKIRFVVR